MREISAVVTHGGQVTIPEEVRQLLGLKQGDEVVFIIEDSQIRIASRSIDSEGAAFEGADTALTAEQPRETVAGVLAEEQLRQLP